MKTYMTLILIFFILFFIMPAPTMGQIKKLAYDPSKIELYSIKIHDKNYERVVFENALAGAVL